MMRSRSIVEGISVRNADCRDALALMKENSVDMVATDPPYFLDGMDDGWSGSNLRGRASDASSRTSCVSGLPSTMRFDPKQGDRLEEFMFHIMGMLARVLKPGGFLIAFAQPRLYGSLDSAVRRAGFLVRDMGVWEHDGGQGKAFRMNHVVERMKVSQVKKRRLVKSMGGRKTPQLRPKFEPFVIGQNPLDGRFVDNWERWGTGLIMPDFPTGQQTTVFRHDKPRERIDHMTVKPVGLMERILQVFSVPQHVVVDPFMGSGTTGVACVRTGRRFVGAERDEGHYRTAVGRIKKETGR